MSLYEIKTLNEAIVIIDTQNKEIEQLKGVLQELYDEQKGLPLLYDEHRRRNTMNKIAVLLKEEDDAKNIMFLNNIKYIKTERNKNT